MFRALKNRLKELIFVKKEIFGRDNIFKLKTPSFRKISVVVNGSNNRIFADGGRLENLSLKITGNKNSIVIESGTGISGAEILIDGNNCEIRIGRDNRLDSGHFMLLANGDESHIEIGNKNHFAWGHHNLSAAEGKAIFVGDDCLFSNDVYISTSDFHRILDAKTGVRLNNAKSVHIGNRVWTASFVRILKGAIIADDSVVGSGAVVTRQFERGTVIAGNPACAVKSGIRWQK